MTIREWICKNEARMAAERLTKLETIGAPKVMLEGIRKEITELESGKLKIGGDKALLDVEFGSFEQKKGKGGKVYVQINGNVNYFPVAQFGRYIAVAQ